MKVFIKIFLIIILGSCAGNKRIEGEKVFSIRSRIATLVSAMVEENMLNEEYVGIAGEETEQWKRFVKLSELATNEELISLSDHDNPVVRGYFFRALANRKSSETFSILMKHLSDTTRVQTFSGCIMSEEMLGDYFINIVTPNLIDTNLYKLNKQEQAWVDSVLLFDKSIVLYARTRLLIDIKPEEKFYSRVKEITLEGSEDFALPTLAKFQREIDKQLIINKLNSTNSGDCYYALMAVRNYPNADFFPHLERLHNLEMTKKMKLTIPEIRMLYQAIVQYKNEASRKLIEQSLSAKVESISDYQMGYHLEYIYLALVKYPDNIYNGLKEQIKLSDIQLHNIEYSLDSDT